MNRFFNIRKIKLIYLGLFLAIAKNFLSTSNIIPYPDIIDDIVSAFMLIIFLIVIIKEKYSTQNLIIYILISGIALYGAFITGYKIIAVSILIILAIRQEPINNIARFLFHYKFLLLLINTVSALMLTAVGLTNIGGYYENGARYRIHFGYGMPGHFADCVLDLIILWIWINYKNIKTQDYIKLFLISIFTYICTDSRLLLIISMFLVLSVYIIKHTRRIDWLLQKMVILIVPVLTLFMMSMTRLFAEGNSFAYKVDSLLNTRIRLNGYRLEQYGTTLLGQNCPLISNGFSWIWLSNGGAFDNIYMWLMINMGIVWLLIITICFWIFAKKNHPLINLLMIVWSLCAMIDMDFLNAMCCFTILLMTLLLDRENDENYKFIRKINRM